ncbi:hypothetical protein ACIHJG_38610 [Streptomyces sp. NPDC052415]|uniref:hypothetical protein n=1 Tax=Streptomyces sp. NPDC052415 TaxID=3365690 RepID=UPI0037D0192B
MNNFVNELSQIMPPPAEGGTIVDWDHVERNYELPFPADFKDFIRRYGAGLIDDYLSVKAPDPGNRFIDLIQSSFDFAGTLRGVRDTLPVELSHPLESRVGGIILWAANEDGDLCFWISDGHNPDRWRVGVYSRNFNDWNEYPFGFSEFLVGVLKGEIESPFSRSDFPSKRPGFKFWRTYLDELLDEG